jgi:hypothetical protein
VWGEVASNRWITDRLKRKKISLLSESLVNLCGS